MSLKEQILSAKDTKLEKVEVPEWNATVWIKEMSGIERDRYEVAAFPAGKARDEGYMETLLVHTLCDEQGNRVFCDGDVATLGGKSASVIVKLHDVAKRVNRLRKEDVEQAAKN